MKFAIRDDDTCFFTKPEELEKVYGFLDDGDTVSFSVVLNTVPKHKTLTPFGEHEYKNYPISENEELINYLREKVKAGEADILLHGYSHEYKEISPDVWQTEFEWKTEEELTDNFIKGKKELSELFDTEVSVLVPPNNNIDKKGISAMEKAGMDLSGILQFRDRKFSFRYLINFIKRWGFRFIYGYQYPSVLRFENHIEVNAFTADSFDRLKKEYAYCKKKDIPFVIYTHYWALLENPKSMEIFRNIVDYVKKDGAECVGLSSVFKMYKNQKVD